MTRGTAGWPSREGGGRSRSPLHADGPPGGGGESGLGGGEVSGLGGEMIRGGKEGL